MTEVIIKEVEGRSNVVLGGDTNATPGNKAIKILESELKSVFKGSLKTTFNMKRKSYQGYATAVVDMILVSPDVEVIEKSCPQVDISDHLPLAATLKIS